MEDGVMRFGQYCILLFIVIFQSGCITAREYASVKKTLEVDRAFQSGELNPAYVYYYNGPDRAPHALLALERNYELKSMYWHEFSGNGQLQSWMSEMQRMTGEFDDLEYVTVDYRGMVIFDPDKKKIGMIYTKYHWVVAWMGEGQSVYVTQPEPSGIQRAPFRRIRYRDDW